MTHVEVSSALGCAVLLSSFLFRVLCFHNVPVDLTVVNVQLYSVASFLY